MILTQIDRLKNHITDYKYIVTYHICLFSDDPEVNGKGW